MRRTSARSATPSSLAQNAGEVLVAERPMRVEPVANGEEVVEVRVRGAQGLRVPIVDLAPVRPAVDVLRDRLDGLEVRVVLAPVVLVHGDVPALAAVRGG